MEERTSKRLRDLTVAVFCGAAAGVAYMPFISEIATPVLALKFAVQGMLITLLVFGFEFFVAPGPMSEPVRRAPFAVVFLAKTVITTLLVVVAYGVGGLVLFPNRFATASALHDLARDTSFALAVAGVFQLLVMVRNLIGGRVLTNIVLGRYHRPLSEERIFMFVDVSGSTALAERAGAIGAYSMISRFFFDVAQETVRFAGETHAYIGDAVIVTWPLEHGLENARCLRCYFGICDRIETRSSLYERDFGVVPRFRVSLHGGPVVAGECGDDKRQIVYFGDTINTAARIQEACKEFERPLLLSRELISRMALLPGYSATSLGRAKLRGRENEVELFTVERLATPHHRGSAN
jgi:adenylate cyclase